jgi:hypothetical protein
LKLVDLGAMAGLSVAAHGSASVMIGRAASQPVIASIHLDWHGGRAIARESLLHG